MTNKSTTFSAFILFIATLLAPVGAAHAFSDQLIGNLTSQLGVSEKQAVGGSGAILSYAKDTMSSSDYSTISDALPGFNDLAGMAPQNDSGSSSSLLGQASSFALNSVGGAEGISTLANDFTGLGMSPDMIQQFVPIILGLAQTEGGQQVMGLLETAILGD